VFENVWVSQSRMMIHFVFAIILYGLYGGQVCPFLEGLTLWQLLTPLVTGFSILLLSRIFFQKKTLLAIKAKRRVFAIFAFDWLFFIVIGLVISCYHGLWYGAPLISGLKVVLGLTTLGFYISIDMALHYERLFSKQLILDGLSITPDDKPFSLTRKFVLFSIISVFFYGMTIFLIVNKDLAWLLNSADVVSPKHAARYILTEITFVSAALLGYLLLVIVSFAKNLKLLLSFQNTTLQKVSTGCLDVRVPIVSNDEFGLMAYHTNDMIKNLRLKSVEVLHTREVAIVGLAALAEARDNETGAHIIRTQHYVKALAEHLAKIPQFSLELTSQSIELMYKSAPLHDVGKVGIPDAILLKPGKLTVEEFEVMKQHPVIGYKALMQAEHENIPNNQEKENEEESFLYFAREIEK